jgi:glycosyltransferase involved in cell wall biosynthesis
MLRPVFERLRERRDVDIRLFVVGGEPDRSMGDRWYRRVHIPAGFSHYPAFVSWLRHRSASWDIAVAPLRDTPFNRSKSDLKFLEYSALGLPGVFSDIVPYNQSVRDGETGLLVPNGGGAWHDAILRLAQDPMLRERIASAARAQVIGGRCLSHGASDYLALLLGLRPSPMITAESSSLSPADQAGANRGTQA